MLLHLRDEQLESGAKTEIKPLLLLLSNSETCSLLSHQREGGESATILAQETLQKMLCQAAILYVIFLGTLKRRLGYKFEVHPFTFHCNVSFGPYSFLFQVTVVEFYIAKGKNI